MTKHPELFAALGAPFHPSDVRTRKGDGGREYSYIRAETAMNRLDEVVGPENWRCSYRVVRLTKGGDAAICSIGIRIDGEWVDKEDAGGFAEMTKGPRGAEVPDDENTAKTGFGDAFKRTAAAWGIARYFKQGGGAEYVGPDGEVLGASPPGPAPARHEPAPRHEPSPATRRSQGQRNGYGGYGGEDGPPRSGKALFAWVKREEQEHGPGLLRHLNDWAKAQGFPGRMVDWDAAQVSAALAEAARERRSIGAGNRDPGQDDDR